MVRLRRDDVMLGALPLAHSFGLSAVMNAALYAGTRLELMPHFEAKAAWRLIKDRGITVLTGVPTMYKRLAEHQDSTRHTDLVVAIVSGAACPPEVARAVWLRMGVPIVERYGLTEASPLTWRELRPRSEAGDVGQPGWGVRIRACDEKGAPLATGKEGELWAKTPSMLLRYLDPRDTAEAMRDGWVRTGDLGKLRPDGRVLITGRLKDVILSGGYSIAAGEVERVLGEHPAIAEVAVVGVPDGDLGEEVAAAVVFRARHEVSNAELDAHVAAHLAGWKRPRQWRIVEALPRTAIGKVRREDVAALFKDQGRATRA
jgi:long-chain acyl-CoA synthetase